MTSMHGPNAAPFTARAVSWPARVLYGLVLAALLVIGFFFLTVALVAGALVALVVLARLWWLTRKASRTRTDDSIEGEFAVVEEREAVRRIDHAPPRR